ncbi:MAG: PQQ-dependent sugar dehydrogenase [Terrimesophilobacter sp.]
MRRGVWVCATVVAASVVLAGCSVAPTPTPSGRPPLPSATTLPVDGPVAPVGNPTVLVTGLTSPWSVVHLSSGSSLISERDTGKVLEYTSSGTVREVGVVTDVGHGGEGGLLGLAVAGDSGTALFAYLTTESDNRIVRMLLIGAPGKYTIGPEEPILTGLAKAGNHNGGRIAFGPDGMLYATVGDAGQPSRAQDLKSLNGKILRMKPDGSVPTDNPFPGSLVYSLGHRNPQGLTWDDNGQLWASEFGQNTWDELNRIEPGKNYGWPTVEGIGTKPGFVDPVYQWATAEASPSGLAYVRGTLFLAALRGQRLWAIFPGQPMTAEAWFQGKFGRIRDAIPGPNGSLWVLTNNTDGRGSPREGDDKLLQVRLSPLREG